MFYGKPGFRKNSLVKTLNILWLHVKEAKRMSKFTKFVSIPFHICAASINNIIAMLVFVQTEEQSHCVHFFMNTNTLNCETLKHIDNKFKRF